jgi:hypothetical protein
MSILSQEERARQSPLFAETTGMKPALLTHQKLELMLMKQHI